MFSCDSLRELHVQYTLCSKFVDCLGVHSVEELLSMDLDEFVKNSDLNSKQTKTFTKKFNKLQKAHNKLIMWLKRNGLEEYLEGFSKLGYFDIEVIKDEMDEYEMKKIIATINGSPADNKQLIQAVEKLRMNSDGWIILRIIYFFFQCIFFLFKWVCKYYCKNNYLPHFLFKSMFELYSTVL